jgi:DNA-binding beta-propeller fold protein YncE
VRRSVIALIALLGVGVYAQQQQQQAPQGRGQQAGEPGGRGGQGRGGQAQGQGGGGRGGNPNGVPNFTPPPGAVEIPFEATTNIVKLPPEVGTLGEVVGVARNSKGEFFIYTRAAQTRLYHFDRNGKFIKEIGKDLYGWDFAHTVRIDKYDNIWVTDEGSNMIIKFNPAGTEVLMTIGRKWEMIDTEHGRPEHPQPGVPPVHRPNAFWRPTDVAWDLQDNVFIADGYYNARVAKVSKDGDWLGSVGEKGNGGNGPLQFNTPHTIANDSKGNIYVGDRGNNRIQVLNPDLTLKAEWRGFGAPWALCVSPAPNEYLYTADPTGHIYKVDLNDGKILGYLGSWGKRVGQFHWIHEIHCQSENELYVGEIQNWRMQKLVLKPAASRPTAGR